MTSAAKPESNDNEEVLEFPASVAQKAFFYLEQVEPGVTPFNIPVRFVIEGPLDGEILKNAVNEIIKRHEGLRTFFEDRDGEIFQVVVPKWDFALDAFDLSALDEKAREEELLRLGIGEARKRFDLRRLPLLRAMLVFLGAEKHVLHITIHHAVADGWSLGLLAKEIAAHYAALVEGRRDPLPELPIQYADFSVWQRDFLQGPEIAGQLEYWKDRLADMQETEFPTDFPRPPVKNWNGDIVSVLLPRELTDRLNEMARAKGATLFHLFLAVCKVLLRKNSGSDDIAVGAPVAGRDRPELEPLIGTFINSVILRTDLSGNPPFAALLEKVRATAVGAMENHELPFEMLVRELRPHRHPGRNPLFQINYTHQRAFMRSETFAGITMTGIPSVSPGTIFDVNFFTVERDGVWRLSCDYCTDLFERATALRWLAQFQKLLVAVAENPDCPIDDLSLLDEAETKRLLDWSGKATAYPRDSTIGRLFASVAGNFPDKPALVQDEESVSYREMLSRASALAKELGVLPPGTPVGILATGSLDVIVGLLGILLAGGAYVPVDPAQPMERICFLLRDAGVSLVVTDGSARVECEGTRTIVVPEADVAPGALPVSEVSATDPAYILYTSGSTGQPKGVIVPHRAVIRLVRGTDYMEFREDDVFLQAAPLSFDASTFEIWGALLNGATLVVPPPGSLALDRIALSVREHGVTTLWLTSGLFQTMVDEHLDELAGLRNLLAGGDVLSIPHLRRALAALPGTRLINGYGPTENTTFTTCHAIAAADLELTSVPIGRPIPNTTVFLLDEAGKLVPVGIPGELHTGGDGLATGYLHDRERTDSVFLDGLVPGAGRLYKTGDLARWRENGTLEFLGRSDRQVKIRGVRVEPGEVEAAIAMHPRVAECRVGTRGRSASSKILVAWVRPNGPLDREQLMDFLTAKLPAFLRPDAIVFVDRFPLTTSGKIDMSALPNPDDSTRTKSASPETATEKRLAAIWSELLGTDSIGRDDNFFHLGGHSLLALRLFSRIHRDWDLTLPLATLLRAPSLRMLGSLVDRELAADDDREGSEPVLAVIHAEGAGTPLFCIHAGDGGILVYKKLMPYLDGGRPVLAIESPGLHADEKFHVPGIEETATLYLDSVRRRQPHGPYLLAGYSYGGTVAYEMALQLQAVGEEVALLALFDTATPDVKMIKAGLAERLRRHLQRKGAHGLFDRTFQTLVYFSGRLSRRALPVQDETAEVHSDDRRRELREAHAKAMSAYSPGRYAGKLTLFRASDHGGSIFDPPRDMGWSGLVDELDVIPASGSHISLFDGKNIGTLAKNLQASLSACRH
ncbi:MAG: amino acid adenylation domain-containing protein [Verrucomicrobiae bacterium]